jgi:hypothetical protein
VPDGQARQRYDDRPPARQRLAGDGFRHRDRGADPQAHRQVARHRRLCHHLLSVAQVSAGCTCPWALPGVVVGELEDERLVLYRPAQAGNRPDVALLEQNRGRPTVVAVSSR